MRMTLKILLKISFILNCIVFTFSATPTQSCSDVDNSAITTAVYGRSTSSSGTPLVRFDTSSSASIQYFVQSLNPLEIAGTETILQFKSSTSRAHYNNNVGGTWGWVDKDDTGVNGLLVTKSDCSSEGGSFDYVYKCEFVEYTVRNCLVGNSRAGKALIFDKQEFTIFLVFDIKDSYTFSQSLTNYENDVIIRTTYGCPTTFDSTTEKCYTTQIISIDSSSLTVEEDTGGDGNFRFGDTARVRVGINVDVPTQTNLDLETDEDTTGDSTLEAKIYENFLDTTVSIDGTNDQVKLILSHSGDTFSRNAYIQGKTIVNDASFSGIQFKIEMNMTGGVYDFSQSSEYILGTSGDEATIDIEFTLAVELKFPSGTMRQLQEESSQTIKRDFSYRIENFDPDSLNEFLQEIRQSLDLDGLDNQDEPEPEQAKDDKTLTIILATVLTFFGVLAIIITLVCLLRKRQDPGKPVNCESEVRNSKSKDMTDNRAHIQDASEQI